MTDVRILVDARPITHPTAGGRGIGNYTLGLLRGLVEIGVPTTALVARDEDRHALDGALPAADIRVWRGDVVRDHATSGAAYLATGLFLHPISFDAVPRFVTDCRMPVVGVMYDVIPYRYPASYLIDENARRQARLRAPLVRTVDLVVAISQFAAETAIIELGLDRRRVRTIGAGFEPRFHPSSAGPPPSGGGYVVAVTGGDGRKNTEGLLRAWAAVPPSTRAGRRLVVIAAVEPPVIQQWRRVADDAGCGAHVEFTGPVSEVEMVHLLQHAELAVQPSMEEGFGLTVIEAAACAVPVICSNTSSLPEVLDEPAATFDPADPDDMARAIDLALVDPAHRSRLHDAGARAVARWRWDRVATDLADAIDGIEVSPPAVRQPVPRLAVISAIDASGATLATLRASEGVEVVTLVDPADSVEPVRMPQGSQVWPAAAFGRYVKYHDFDHVLVLVDIVPTTSSRIAAAHDVHVWLPRTLGDADDVTPLEPAVLRARSVVTRDLRSAELVRRCVPGAPPVLVLPPVVETGGGTDGHWSADAAAGALLDWMMAGHHTPTPVTVAGSH